MQNVGWKPKGWRCHWEVWGIDGNIWAMQNGNLLEALLCQCIWCSCTFDLANALAVTCVEQVR